MIRTLTTITIALALSSSAILPSFADETTTGTSPEATISDASASKSAPAKAPASAPSTSKSTGIDVNLPTRFASFVTGCTFGIPVAIVRRTGIEIAEGTKDLLGDTNNWFLMVPAGVLTVPFGGVSGGFGGVLYGVKNAWVNSGDEPFGKDTFSLGDM